MFNGNERSHPHANDDRMQCRYQYNTPPCIHNRTNQRHNMRPLYSIKAIHLTKQRTLTQTVNGLRIPQKAVNEIKSKSLRRRRALCWCRCSAIESAFTRTRIQCNPYTTSMCMCVCVYVSATSKNRMVGETLLIVGINFSEWGSGHILRVLKQYEISYTILYYIARSLNFVCSFYCSLYLVQPIFSWLLF